MRVLINGLPLFGKRLANDLNEACPGSRFTFLDTYYSFGDRLRFLILLPFSDAVISMNGVSDRSGSLDAVMVFRKKLIMQWQGTDSLLAIDRKKNGTLYRKYIDYATNFVDSDWLHSEVCSLGVEAHRVGFKTSATVAPVESYSELRVMSYIAQNRQEFYGLSRVIGLAKCFPEIKFDVYGSESCELYLPENLHLHGWVNPQVFMEQLRQHPVFIRLTEHEGFPVSVIEAMSVGCEVIMSMPYNKVIVSDGIEKDESCLRYALDKVRDRQFKPNSELIEFAHTTFSKKQVLEGYSLALKSIVDNSGPH